MDNPILTFKTALLFRECCDIPFLQKTLRELRLALQSTPFASLSELMSPSGYKVEEVENGCIVISKAGKQVFLTNNTPACTELEAAVLGSTPCSDILKFIYECIMELLCEKYDSVLYNPSVYQALWHALCEG